MFATTMLFYVLVGMALGARAGDPRGDLTLRELEQKIDNLDELERSMEGMKKEVTVLENELETRNNVSEDLIQKVDTLENLNNSTNTLEQKLIDRLNKIEQIVTKSQKEIATIQKQLEYGGKNFQTFPNNSAVQLRDQDYLKLQFLGARNAWLGCPDGNKVCDLRTCPSSNLRFDGRCWGEEFQIIGEGTSRSPIKCGHRIRLRYLREQNTWMGCPANNYCDKRTCPGTIVQGRNFKDGCWGETFKIYARGKTNGQIIYNGDVVMLYYERGNKYVSIQGENFGDNTSLNFCPAVAPPPYLSYGICSKNAFRIYQKL